MSTVYIQARHPVTDDAVTVAFDCSAPALKAFARSFKRQTKGAK